MVGLVLSPTRNTVFQVLKCERTFIVINKANRTGFVVRKNCYKTLVSGPKISFPEKRYHGQFFKDRFLSEFQAKKGEDFYD